MYMCEMSLHDYHFHLMRTFLNLMSPPPWQDTQECIEIAGSNGGSHARTWELY